MNNRKVLLPKRSKRIECAEKPIPPYFFSEEFKKNNRELLMAMHAGPEALAAFALALWFENKAVFECNTGWEFLDALEDQLTRTYTFGEIAQVLQHHGYDINRYQFIEWMREKGYLIKRHGYDVPYWRCMGRSWVDMENFNVLCPKLTDLGATVLISHYVNENPIKYQYLTNNKPTDEKESLS